MLVGQEVLVNGEVENSSPATSSSPSDDGTNNDVAKKRNVDDGFDKVGTRPFDINQFFVSETLLPFSGGVSICITLGGLGEFETVMQTLDYVSGLHNFREFSQPPECLDEAM